MKTRVNLRKLCAGVLAAALTMASVGASTDVSASAKPRLNMKKAAIYVGGTVKLKILHKKKKVKWSSSNKKIASVSKKGLVKGKKKGTVKITAKTSGRKYTCKVTVKAKKQPSNNTAVPGNTAASVTANPVVSPRPVPNPVNPSPGATDSQGKNTSAPDQTATSQPGANETSAPVNPSDDPGTATTSPTDNQGNETPSPTDDMQTPEPEEPGGLVSVKEVPAAGAADTLTVGKMAVKLGMTKEEVKTAIGAEPDREEESPLGFDIYIYNPSMDYTNFLLIQFDHDKVAGMSTISNYFTYEDILTSGSESASDLSAKGFSGMGSSYDYEAGYKYTGDNEYVLAFVDHQGSGKLYAVEVFAKQTSLNTSGDTSLDKLFKAEYGTYNDIVNSYMAKELFDWACAFRAVKGLSLFEASTSDGAQKHSDDMLANGFVGEDSSDGTARTDRFETYYPGYFGSAECNSSRSVDAFGFVTWLLDDTESGSYAYFVKEKDKYGETIYEYYLCTGFSGSGTGREGSGSTYAALDLYYY